MEDKPACVSYSLKLLEYAAGSDDSFESVVGELSVVQEDVVSISSDEENVIYMSMVMRTEVLEEGLIINTTSPSHSAEVHEVCVTSSPSFCYP